MIYLNYYYYILFYPLYIISIMMIFISNSWFSMWIIMEINLILFLFLICNDLKSNKEVLMIYFLIQSFNSYFFILFILMLNMFNIKEFYNIMILILMMKLGMPPFYKWYFKLMLNLNWINNFNLSLVQKIISLVIFNNLLNMNYLNLMNMLLIIMLFLIMMIIMNLNFNNLKLIMSMSSLIHTMWIIILMLNNEIMSISYFLNYMFMNFMVMSFFYKMNINNLNDFINMKFYFNNYLLLLFIFLNLISLPPFLSFMNKLISVQSMILNYSFYINLMLIMMNLMMMMYYFRLIYMISLKFYITNKLIFFYYKNYNYKFLIFFCWSLIFMIQLFEIF